MANRWVDNSGYFGLDRRRKPSRRWNDRRRLDEAGEPPPLGALLRRLRVRIAAPGAEARRHALDMLGAAIGEATRLGWRRCAAVLMMADEALRAGARDAAATADTLIVEAQEHAAYGR
jgi:hypothetical protein